MKQSFSLMSLVFLFCATFAAADGISLPGPVAGTEEIVAWNSNEALQHTLTYSPLEAQDLTHGGNTDALSLRITETPPGLLPAVIVWSGKDASVWEGTLAWPTFGGDFVIPFDSCACDAPAASSLSRIACSSEQSRMSTTRWIKKW